MKKTWKTISEKLGKADEERLAIGVQKYSCLYNKAVSAFHNKNQKKNAWVAAAKDIGLETGETLEWGISHVSKNYLLISFPSKTVLGSRT